MDKAPIALEPYASLTAEIDSGSSLESVIDREKITLETWSQAQAFWLGKMAVEAEKKRFETTNRYQILYSTKRKLFDIRQTHLKAREARVEVKPPPVTHLEKASAELGNKAESELPKIPLPVAPVVAAAAVSPPAFVGGGSQLPTDRPGAFPDSVPPPPPVVAAPALPFTSAFAPSTPAIAPPPRIESTFEPPRVPPAMGVPSAVGTPFASAFAPTPTPAPVQVPPAFVARPEPVQPVAVKSETMPPPAGASVTTVPPAMVLPSEAFPPKPAVPAAAPHPLSHTAPAMNLADLQAVMDLESGLAGKTMAINVQALLSAQAQATPFRSQTPMAMKAVTTEATPFRNAGGESKPVVGSDPPPPSRKSDLSKTMMHEGEAPTAGATPFEKQAQAQAQAMWGSGPVTQHPHSSRITDAPGLPFDRPTAVPPANVAQHDSKLPTSPPGADDDDPRTRMRPSEVGTPFAAARITAEFEETLPPNTTVAKVGAQAAMPFAPRFAPEAVPPVRPSSPLQPPQVPMHSAPTMAQAIPQPPPPLAPQLPPQLPPLAPAAPPPVPAGKKKFSINQFASLTAEIAENPAKAEETRRRYGVTEAEHREESMRWTEDFSSNSDLRQRYFGIVQRYREYLKKSSGGQ